MVGNITLAHMQLDTLYKEIEEQIIHGTNPDESPNQFTDRIMSQVNSLLQIAQGIESPLSRRISLVQVENLLDLCETCILKIKGSAESLKKHLR